MALGNLTPQIGQGLNADQLRYIKLALNGANVIYNLDAPASAYPPGVPIVQEGYVLDGQRDARYTDGIDQPYASEPGFVLEKPQIDTLNGFKGGVFVNTNTNEAMITVAGMDGFWNPQDQASGVEKSVSEKNIL